MMIAKNQKIHAMLTHPIFLVSLINALGALIAFLKDVTQAMILGTSIHADAFALAYFFPDMIGNCLIGMAIGTACVPVFSKIVALSKFNVLHKMTKQTVLQTIGLSFIFYLICLLFAPKITRWLAGMDGSLNALTYPLLLVMLPIIILYPLALVGIAVHQSFQKFYISVSGPVFFNLFFLLAFIVAISLNFSDLNITKTASWGVIMGVIAMCLFVWVPLKGIFSANNKTSEFKETPMMLRPELRRIWKVFWYFMLILFAAQAVFVIERYLAARMEVGAVAALNYATRLAQLPIWIYVSAFAVIILPKLSQSIALNQKSDLQKSLLNAVKSILFVTVPTSLLLLLLREPVITLLFKRGAFNEHSVLLTSGILEGYAITIVFQSISAVALRYYLAAESLKIPAILSLLSAATAIGLDIGLSSMYGVRGLGYGAAGGALINAIGFIFILNRDLNLHALIRPTLRLIIANIPPVICLMVIILLINPMSWINGYVSCLSYLVSAALFYGVIYIWLARWLKIIKGDKWQWQIH